MKKQYKAVIFDLDGTLLNTLGDLAASTNYALAEQGLPTRALEEVRQFVGNGIRKLVERAVPAGTAPELTEKVFAGFRRHYGAHYMDRTVAYAGILPLLDALQAQGFCLGVVSNKADEMVQKLYQAFFPRQMTAVMGEQAGYAKKPAPDMVLAVLRRLGCASEQAVYVGDSDVDAQTAKNAGLDCILVDWGFRSRESLEGCAAACVVSSPKELAKAVGAEFSDKLATPE